MKKQETAVKLTMGDLHTTNHILYSLYDKQKFELANQERKSIFNIGCEKLLIEWGAGRR